MNETTLSLTRLESMRDEWVERLRKASEDAQEAQEALKDIDAALVGFRRILDIPETKSDESERVSSRSASVHLARDVLAPNRPIKRIRSTDMIAELIAKAEKPLTRTEVHDRFRQTFGFPETWRSPVNALNNALTRALERDLIAVTDDGHYTAGSARARMPNW